jgi:hypothetical protein
MTTGHRLFHQSVTDSQIIIVTNQI